MSSIDERRDADEIFDQSKHTQSTKDAAEQLGVSVTRVRELCTSRELPAVRCGGRWFLDHHEIYTFGVKRGLIHDRITVIEDRLDELERQVERFRTILVHATLLTEGLSQLTEGLSQLGYEEVEG